MTNYDEMSYEELMALKEKRMKDALVKELSEADALEKLKETEAHDTEVADRAVQNYIDSLKIEQPNIAKEDVKSKPVTKSFTQTIGHSGHEITFTDADLKDIDVMYKEFGIEDKTWEYGSPGAPESHRAGVGSFNFTAGSDNGCDESSQLDNNWSVQRHFCNIIWHAKECYAGLGRVCATTCDVNAGHNARLDIKVISARADPTSVSACTCLSCASNTFDRYSITLNQLGDYAVLCSWDEFQVGSSYRRAVIESMAKHWGTYFDAQIFAAISGAASGYTETLNNTLDCNGVISGSCCTNGSDIYGRLLDLDARMRAAGYNPDYLIVSPTIANYFKYMQHPTTSLAMPSIEMDGTVLTKIGHINVIEYCGATACSTATATEFAWLIDSSRAVGQAFGKQPSLEFERDAECNSWKLVMWAYWGVSALDVNAIGSIVTPNS